VIWRCMNACVQTVRQSQRWSAAGAPLWVQIGDDQTAGSDVQVRSTLRGGTEDLPLAVKEWSGSGFP